MGALIPILIYFVYGLGKDLWVYFYLNQQIPAQILNWDIVPKSESCFLVRANYFFEMKEKKYYNSTIFSPPYYLNWMSAEEKIQFYANKAWKCWISSKNPNFSSLEKKFPLKKIIYTVIVYGIFGYFVFLLTYRKQFFIKN